MADLNCSKMTAVNMLKALQAVGLIDVEQKNGLANIIYVKSFVSGGEEALDRSEKCTGQKNKPAEEDQSTNQTSSNIEPVYEEDQSDYSTGASQDSIPGVVQKLDPNNNDFKNIDPSETNYIRLSAERVDTPPYPCYEDGSDG